MVWQNVLQQIKQSWIIVLVSLVVILILLVTISYLLFAPPKKDQNPSLQDTRKTNTYQSAKQQQNAENAFKQGLLMDEIHRDISKIPADTGFQRQLSDSSDPGIYDKEQLQQMSKPQLIMKILQLEQDHESEALHFQQINRAQLETPPQQDSGGKADVDSSTSTKKTRPITGKSDVKRKLLFGSGTNPKASKETELQTTEEESDPEPTPAQKEDIYGVKQTFPKNDTDS
jgi:hypothetical protein